MPRIREVLRKLEEAAAHALCRDHDYVEWCDGCSGLQKAQQDAEQLLKELDEEKNRASFPR